MNLIVFNNPAELPWQTNLCDLMLLTMFVASVVGYTAVAITALGTARPPFPVEWFTVAVVVVYVACMAAMVIENVSYEGALTKYIVVQIIGLIVMSALALFPIRASRRRGESLAPDQRELRSTATVSGK